MRLRLPQKLFAVLFGGTLLASLTGAVWVQRTAQARFEAELRERAMLLATNLAATSARGVETENAFRTLEPLVAAVARQPEVAFVHVLAAEGEVLASSRLRAGRRAPVVPVSCEPGAPPRPSMPGVVEVLAPVRGRAEATLERASGDCVGFVHVGLSTETSREETRAFAIHLAWVVGAVAAISALGALAFSRWTANALRAVLEATRAVGAGDYRQVLPEDRRDELGEAARGFNRMVRELADARALLESRVAERTAELKQALDKLTSAQEQLVQSGKIAAVGQLAAGVAHEINNPLGVILGFAQGLERRVAEDSPYRMPVASIAREALRCKKLVQELLTFSRASKKTVETLDLREVVRGAGVLLETRARTQEISVVYELPAEPVLVMGSRTQLEQVLVNLGTNALDATGRGGTLTVRAGAGGGRVRVEVADTGTGIPEEIRGRIFEPFFTTKEVGKGTGLGLSLAHEIVQQHGGTLAVESAVGRGTTMVVALPEAAQPLLARTA